MSKSFELTGTVHAIHPTQTFGSGFTKREFVLLITGEDVNPMYPDHVAFNVIKDKCSMLDGYTVGQEVNVKFNIGGRLWQKSVADPEKCFNDLQAWKIEAIGSAPAQQRKQSYTPPASAAPANQFDNADVEGDDIPF